MSVAAPERFHALDLLRGLLMLLGVVLHGALFFMRGPATEGWPAREAATSGFFNLLMGWIHLFRMPAFFLLAGFFGALLWQRLGARGFLRHRTKRLLLPLAAAWVVLTPIVLMLMVAVGAGRGQAAGAATAASAPALTLGGLLRRANLMHLWFLWYLFLLCLGVGAVLLAGRRLPSAWRGRLAGWIEATATSRYSFLLGVILTALTLRPMQTAAIATGTALWPRWSILFAYFVFFAFGWVWHRRSAHLATLRHGWLGRLLLGALLGLVSTIFNFGAVATRSRPSVALLIVTAAACWWMILGLIGLFERHFSHPWRASRYLADSSYWVYLVHIPVLLCLALLLRSWSVPIGVKYLAMVTLAFALCLASYHVFVRYTFVGAFLNGRRERR